MFVCFVFPEASRDAPIFWCQSGSHYAAALGPCCWCSHLYCADVFAWCSSVPLQQLKQTRDFSNICLKMFSICFKIFHIPQLACTRFFVLDWGSCPSWEYASALATEQWLKGMPYSLNKAPCVTDVSCPQNLLQNRWSCVWRMRHNVHLRFSMAMRDLIEFLFLLNGSQQHIVENLPKDHNGDLLFFPLDLEESIDLQEKWKSKCYICCNRIRLCNSSRLYVYFRFDLWWGENLPLLKVSTLLHLYCRTTPFGTLTLLCGWHQALVHEIIFSCFAVVCCWS